MLGRRAGMIFFKCFHSGSHRSDIELVQRLEVQYGSPTIRFLGCEEKGRAVERPAIGTRDVNGVLVEEAEDLLL